MDKKIHEELLKIPGVMAVGTGKRVKNGKKTGQVCTTVGVIKKLPLSAIPPKQVIPSVIGDFDTDVVQIGKIRALQATGRERPARGGLSIGHYEITAGTLGAWVSRDGKPYVLSNNHVLANSNAGKIGDPILQPGPYDGGNTTNDILAHLTEFIPISFGNGVGDEPPDCRVSRVTVSLLNRLSGLVGSTVRLKAYRLATPNLVDAALAEPVNLNWVSREIKDIGIPSGTVMASLQMPVKKSGRTTGFQTGEIIMVDTTIVVGYGNGTATFEEQIVIEGRGFSAGGDSGSLILNQNNQGVGLLFAGSDSEGITIGNTIQNVFNLLGIEEFWS